MNNHLNHIENMLAMPVANVAQTENIEVQDGLQELFVIANFTRNILYRYATISSNGNVSFHAMSPFKFVDDNQQDANYRNKTVYVSVNTDSQQNANDPKQFYNNNLGNLLLVLKPFINQNNKNYPNLYNAIKLSNARIKEALVPQDLDNPQLNVINAPAIKLQSLVKQHALDDIEAKDRVTLNIQAYQNYTKEVLELVEQGLLTNAFVFINPTANKVAPSLSIDDGMKAVSNPWLNINTIMNLGLPLSKVPTPNKFRAVVQVIETNDLSVLFSDNDEMLGERVIWTNSENGKTRRALTVLALIKDYNNDTPVLLSITDTVNSTSNNSNARSRVEAFEGLMDKGLNEFIVEGSLSPVVRLKGTNAGRHGNVFFELRADSYKVYQSTSVRNSLEADAFDDLSFEESEGDIDVAQSFVAEVEETEIEIEDSVDLTNDLI